MGVSSKSSGSPNDDKKKKKKEKKAKKKLKKEKKHRRRKQETQEGGSDSHNNHQPGDASKKECQTNNTNNVQSSKENGDTSSIDNKNNRCSSKKSKNKIVTKPSTPISSPSTTTFSQSKLPSSLDQIESSSNDMKVSAIKSTTQDPSSSSSNGNKKKKKKKKRDRDNDLPSTSSCTTTHEDLKKRHQQRNGSTPDSSPLLPHPSKRQKKQKKADYSSASTAAASFDTDAPPSRHPFPVDDTDHCETPLKAYQDIIEILDQICKSLNKSRSNTIIWDPYYCDGGSKKKLQSLGFKNIINENRDFYKDIKSNTLPNYDILITNPPYSGTHIEKLLTFCFQQQNQPFLLLLPHFVYTKDYYQRAFKIPTTSKALNISNTNEDILFFMIPETRYSYLPPMWVNRNTGSTALGKGKETTAPFPSFWYCSTGVGGHNNGNNRNNNTNNKSITRFGKKKVVNISKTWLTQTFGPSGVFQRNKKFVSKLRYACCTKHIPRDFKGEFDTSKKRPNPKARKRALMKKKKIEQQQMLPTSI